jgi:hypothetical protein
MSMSVRYTHQQLVEWLAGHGTIRGAADPLLDPINETTLPEVNQDAIEDEFFLSSVFQAHLRSKCLVPFEGGAFMRNLQLYAALNGGAYAKGIGGFNLTKPLTISSNVFDPRYYVVMIIEYLEDISVLNTGDLAVFSLLETDMANAYLTMSTIMALDLQQNGQLAPRTINMNGWVEFLNNGVDYSYDGNAYSTYGTAQRNGAIGTALNGNTYWGGQTSGAAGTIQYAQFNAMYILAKRGADEPDLFTCNKPLNNFVENRIQQQQRFGQESPAVRDPFFGAMGFRFKNAIVMVDDYFPSSFTAYGKTNNPGGSNLTGTFTSPATTLSNFPLNTALTVGEVGCFFNLSRIAFRLSASSEFGFMPTDFIRAPDNTRVASQLKAAVNVEDVAPWSGVQGYGWTS